jgi:outer membrane protein
MFARHICIMGGVASSYLALTFTPTTARADTLADALQAAFEHNPTLSAQRERLNAAREEVAIARAGYFPRVQAKADASRSNTPPGSLPTSANALNPRFKTTSYGLSAEQPLFDGFKTMHAVNEATESSRAGHQDLRAVEQTTLGEAVTAYLAVLRDRSIAHLREHAVSQLEAELAASRSRLENGDATRTDVAQAAGRLSTAIANRALARGNEAAALETFASVVGRLPRAPQPAPLPGGLPPTLDQAVAIAAQEDPGILAALHRREAARIATQKFGAEALPRVSVHADYTRASYDTAALGTAIDATVGVRVAVPLFDGGETFARVRQSRFLEASRDQELREARNRVRANVAATWARLAAARDHVRATRASVEANRTALAGVREERKYAQRTTLDVLNSEQEVIEALVRLAQSEHDVVQLSYTLLQSIGRLSLADTVTKPKDAPSSRARPINQPLTVHASGTTVTTSWRTTIAR